MNVEISPELSQFIIGLYPEKGSHGKEHALETARLVIEISNEPEYRDLITDRERISLSIAALVHDTGYIREEYWSGTQWEHPYESTKIFLKMAEEIPNLLESDKIMIGLLVLNHDNTNYRFPAYPLFERARHGFTDPVGTPPGPHPGIFFDAFKLGDHLEEIDMKKFWMMLHILQEADSRLGSAQRTIDFSQSRNVPMFADDGGLPGIGIPMWQISALTNVELAVKRAILDAYTQTGKEFAWNLFLQTRDFMKNLIQDSGLTQNQDTIGNLLRREDIEKYIWNSKYGDREMPHTYIKQAFSLEGVPYILGDGFENYTAASRLVNIEQIKSFGRANTKKVQQLDILRGLIIKNYAIDILTELSGALRVFHGTTTQMTREYTLIPPVILSPTLPHFDHTPITINYGNEWVVLAKELGIPEMRVICLF